MDEMCRKGLDKWFGDLYLEHFCIWCRPFLKGQGFSRAIKHH